VFLAGLDLGKMADYTALGIVEATGTEYEMQQAVYRAGGLAGPLLRRMGCYWVKVQGPPVTFAVRHLERWPLGTTYAGIAQDVRQRLAQIGQPCALVADATGVGHAVLELLRQEGLQPIPIIITAGRETTVAEDGSVLVPKAELVSSVAVALQNGQLKIAQALPLADVLARELADFQVTVTASANLTFGARVGAHDDLVLAVALAVYAGSIAFRLPESLPPVIEEAGPW